ncbi:MAG: oxidoreductase [Verrucomicrobia bacterium]|nr:MAG: oxidoreductase [Verrucomicrobiota bacterium]
MKEPKLRWGILSTAEIARKNWKAILDSGNGIVTAVASRKMQRSREFIALCQRAAPFERAPKALGNYEALIAAKDTDAVYVPAPTGLRKHWVIRAAEAGKHVVCEKPCAASLADLREMLDACRRHRVQFLDGVMFMHSRRLERIRGLLDDGRTIGPLRRITSAFSFGAPPEFFASNIRAHSDLEPLGCLGDLGWYCIRFALWTMKFQLPRRVSGRLLAQFRRKDSPALVPTEFSGELFFDSGVSATFYCSFITELEQWVHVSGANGSIYVSDFVLPNRGSKLIFQVRKPFYHVTGCDFRMAPGTRRVAVPEHSHGHPSAQESNLFRNFAQQVRSGQLNETWPEIAWKTQQVTEACLESARRDGKTAALDSR